MFDSAAEFARECGVYRTTVIKWISDGKIKTYKRKGRFYKIPENEKSKIKTLKKPYPKWQMPWTTSEENLIIYSPHLKDKDLAKLLNRNVNSVRIHKTFMRKKGLL